MSVEQEYEALRSGAGGRVVRRDLARLWGPDALDYLQGQCTQDVAVLEVGVSADALLLEPQGKLDAYVRVVRLGDDELVLDTDAGFGEAVLSRLQRFKLRVKAELAVETVPVAMLRGPAAAALAGTPSGGRVVPFAWGPLTGADVFGVGELPGGVVECGEASWEALRVEAGIPRMGAELDERTIAAEAGLLERCVSFTKGCYTGQELVARLDARGNKVARHLRGLVAGDAEIAVGAELHADGRSVGALTSVARSPRMGWVALGYVHRSVGPGATVAADGSSGPVELSVRALPMLA